MSHSVNQHGASHGSMKSYMAGFILSIILTTIPFWMVMERVASQEMTIGVVVICAVVQVIVHLVCFLHLDTKSEGGWNMIAMVFALIIILIIVIASLWIMWNLNENMMMGH